MSEIPTGLTFVKAASAPETFNVLLYGRPKSGKSTAAATAPGPILWVNAEGPGALGYARKIAGSRGTRIDEIEFSVERDPVGTLEEVYKYLRSDQSDHRTVVVDTLAKVRDVLVAKLVVKGSKQSLPQYGQVADKLGGFILALRDLPVNLVLLAHVDVKDDPTEGRIVDPLIGGALTEKIPGEVDVVAYTAVIEEDGQRRYFGQLVEGKGRLGGDRSGSLADARGIRELDLSEWLGAYRAGLTPDESDLPEGLRSEDEAVAAVIDGFDATEVEPDGPGGEFDMDDARAEA